MPQYSHPDAVNGRGSTANRTPSRFNLLSRTLDDDWRDEHIAVDGKKPGLRTSVTEEHSKSIITFNTSPDLPFDRSINAYRGCEHGCIYCYARPSHAFHDLSPGLDFESRLFAKPDAANVLRKTLSKSGYKPAPIAIGTNTDPYQPIERTYRITRQILEVMVETRHPIVITTKSAKVTEDIALLANLAKDDLTGVALSVTTLDAKLARILEPRASTPLKRLETVRELTDAGIYVHVNIAPIIPAITDHEIEAIVEAAAKYGARSVSWIPIRLPHEVAPLFRDWLDLHFPDRADKVMNIIRDLRGGKDNDPSFFSRMRGTGAWADLIRMRVRIAKAKYAIESSKWDVRSDLFVPPSDDRQLSLF